jgi:TatD DNase family protein
MPEFTDVHTHFERLKQQEKKLFSSLSIRVVSVGVDKESSLSILEEEDVIHFIGVHPSFARSGVEFDWLEELAQKARGIGEIGLDPRYGERELQVEIFEKQLEIAERYTKPVQVHSRNAVKECLDILAKYDINAVLLHWFDDENYTKEVNSRSYFVSFGPALLYSKRLQRIASVIDEELILTESDYPVSYHALGNATGPILIPSIVFRLSVILGKNFDETKRLVAENTERYLS